MDDDVLTHMRARVAQIRKVLALAHDPRMIEVLQQVIESGEADIARLEADRAESPNHDIPPPNQH
jgi:hypothetical protein